MDPVLASALSAIVVGILALIGNMYASKKSSERTEALVTYRIGQLETKVDKHNHAIERIYCVEKRLDVDDEKHKVINHRLDDLEEG